ncbi:unnamed protein product, partial [Ixodes pacificus]
SPRTHTSLPPPPRLPHARAAKSKGDYPFARDHYYRTPYLPLITKTILPHPAKKKKKKKKPPRKWEARWQARRHHHHH